MLAHYIEVNSKPYCIQTLIRIQVTSPWSKFSAKISPLLSKASEKSWQFLSALKGRIGWSQRKAGENMSSSISITCSTALSTVRQSALLCCLPQNFASAFEIIAHHSNQPSNQNSSPSIGMLIMLASPAQRSVKIKWIYYSVNVRRAFPLKLECSKRIGCAV